MKAATKTSVRAAVEASATRPVRETATVHTSPEAGLAAEGVLVCHAAVVESAECAGSAALLHVRRSESTVGSMVRVILVASEIVTVEIAAVGESVAVVEKSMASGNKPRVIKNHKATPQLKPHAGHPQPQPKPQPMGNPTPNEMIGAPIQGPA